MNNVSALLTQIENQSFVFNDVIAYIDSLYAFTPTAFVNGTVYNAANQNNGSCKVFSFAQLHHLSVLDTLALFAEHYTAVKNTPLGSDHQNIRNFLFYGWQGMGFKGQALKAL